MKLKLNYQNIFFYIIDFLWPTIVPLSKKQNEEGKKKQKDKEEEIKSLIDDISNFNEEQIKFCYQNTKEIYNSEEERKKNIETKLTTIISLTSILATITIATSFQQLPDYIKNYYIIYVIIKTYIILQLVSALFAAVKGLRRSEYSGITISTIIPKKDSEKNQIYIDIIKSYLLSYERNQYVNSRKIDQMAIAHRALQNLLVSILVFCIINSILIRIV